MGAELSQNSTMDDSSEDPPTSAVLLDSCHFSQVVFNNVEKFYVPGGDVTCHYTLTQNITARGKDWVGIFRVGWKTTREYYTFMWAPLPAAGLGDTAVQQKIQFKAYYLPKDDEYYQFCYVDQDGMVRGASVPFQFRAEAEDDLLVVTTQGEVEEIELQNKNLRQENEELKATCANLQQQNLQLQEELKKTQELQKSLESFRSSTEKLELELNSLKMENKQLKEQSDCTGAELQHGDVPSDKLWDGNTPTERGRLFVGDKLCSLRQQVWDSSSLGLPPLDLPLPPDFPTPSLSQQQDLLKELEEQKHLFQVLQAEKDEADEESQKLRAENRALLRHLSQATEFSPLSNLPQAPDPTPAPGAGGLVFGNPYSAAGGNLGAGVEASLRVCPLCGEVFPGDVDPSQYEAHVRSHLLDCPMCPESFENQQVFEDHLLCHRLE
ncbi:calcium-binding and coiled-coil domain-containing protein 2 [Neopelma chrysocephalum]|uniref:calcium-binding and coiled-coil domain-containing protein 2 n=1 Tax=Neopelma chrysocephalum TaxID=114329 RepID=UPI000FCD0ED2|nr:calcium-binding and coiled-coil domain-containing protein 2 [Neopelma chrysocephalum]